MLAYAICLVRTLSAESRPPRPKMTVPVSGWSRATAVGAMLRAAVQWPLVIRYAGPFDRVSSSQPVQAESSVIWATPEYRLAWSLSSCGAGTTEDATWTVNGHQPPRHRVNPIPIAAISAAAVTEARATCNAFGLRTMLTLVTRTPHRLNFAPVVAVCTRYGGCKDG